MSRFRKEATFLFFETEKNIKELENMRIVLL